LKRLVKNPRPKVFDTRFRGGPNDLANKSFVIFDVKGRTDADDESQESGPSRVTTNARDAVSGRRPRGTSFSVTISKKSRTSVGEKEERTAVCTDGKYGRADA